MAVDVSLQHLAHSFNAVEVFILAEGEAILLATHMKQHFRGRAGPPVFWREESRLRAARTIHALLDLLLHNVDAPYGLSQVRVHDEVSSLVHLL